MIEFVQVDGYLLVVTAASTADGWDGGVVARFGGGAGTAVDASAGMVVRIGSGVGDVGRAVTPGLVPALAGTESGGGSRVGSRQRAAPQGDVDSMLAPEMEPELTSATEPAAWFLSLPTLYLVPPPARESAVHFPSYPKTESGVVAGDGAGAADCTGTSGEVPVLAETESGVAAGDGAGAVGCAGIGGVLAEIESSVATRDGVGTVVCAGTSGTLGETESGVAATEGTEAVASAVTGRGMVACASAADVVPVLAGTESGAAAGDGAEVFACAGIDGAVPALAGSSGSVRGGLRDAVETSAWLRVNDGLEGPLGAVGWGGTGGAVPVLAEIDFADSVRVRPRKAVKASTGLESTSALKEDSKLSLSPRSAVWFLP